MADTNENNESDKPVIGKETVKKEGKKIVKGMNMPNFTVKDAKEKMRSLRNTYSNELVKITKSKSSGSGLDDVYTPTLRWFPTMDRILGAVVKTRESQVIGIPNEDGNKLCPNSIHRKEKLKANAGTQLKQKHSAYKELRGLEVFIISPKKSETPPTASEYDDPVRNGSA
ncbi:hypothetical protein J6590_103242 [Homalodisca vitripennis]|nr:hypothetical protein J6590_103242 [Homalodisca vitripennis]